MNLPVILHFKINMTTKNAVSPKVRQNYVYWVLFVYFKSVVKNTLNFKKKPFDKECILKNGQNNCFCFIPLPCC